MDMEDDTPPDNPDEGRRRLLVELARAASFGAVTGMTVTVTDVLVGHSKPFNEAANVKEEYPQLSQKQAEHIVREKSLEKGSGAMFGAAVAYIVLRR